MTRGIIPIFIPHMGCQNACIFCNQRKISGCMTGMNEEEAKIIIENHLATMNQEWIEIAFYGGSFTGLDIEEQEVFLKLAYEYKLNKKINAIRLSTRPDYVQEPVLKRLKKYGVDTIELGCQSFDDEVLIKSKRGHDAKTAIEGCKRVLEFGFNLGIQLMLGLPSDCYKTWKFSVTKAIELSPSFVRIYPALVIRETELEKIYYEGFYKPLELEQAISWAAMAFKVFYEHSIPVIRMGLQKTDEMCQGRSIIAGPYHESFGELVRSELFKQTLDLAIFPIDGHNEVTIEVNPRQVSLLVGQKRKNLCFFRNTKFIIIQDLNIPLDTLRISDGEETKHYHVMKGEACI